MNLKKIRNFMILIIGVMFFIVQILNQPSCLESYIKEKEIHFNGIITKKFIDKKNHNYPMIQILNKGTSLDYNLIHDLSGVFDFVIEGDTIVKKKGTNTIVVKGVFKDTLFVLDYGCK